MRKIDFSIEKRKHPGEQHYKKNSMDLAYMFAKECHKECKELVKAIVLFGGTARKKQGTKDIDILVVIDDISLKLSKELIQTYRIIIGKIISKVSNRLHITTLKLSSFWEYVRVADPVAVNILRDGFPLLDTGFFDPLQTLLHQGRLRPSKESIYSYLNRSEQTLMNSTWHIMQGTVDLYWAVIDSAHAALMSLGEVPPSPDHVADMIQDRLVKTKLVPNWATNRMRKFYTLSKDIASRKKKELKATEYEKLLKEAQEFVSAMKKIVEKQA